jgi:hypothetical protein
MEDHDVVGFLVERRLSDDQRFRLRFQYDWPSPTDTNVARVYRIRSERATSLTRSSGV